jgi:DNA-binding PadR family transcriptional regulator
MVSELDTKSKRIMEAIYQLGGEAKAPEVKEYTGIEKDGVLHYRLNEKLEPNGYIEARKVDTDSGRYPVKLVELTEKGVEAVGVILEDGNDAPLADQVAHLSEEVKKLHDKVQLYEGKTEAVLQKIDTIPEFSNRIEKIEEQVDEFHRIAERTEEIQRETLDFKSELTSRREAIREAEEVDRSIEEIEKLIDSLHDLGLLDGSTALGEPVEPGPILRQLEEETRPDLMSALDQQHERGAFETLSEIDTETLEAIGELSETVEPEEITEAISEGQRAAELIGKANRASAYSYGDLLDGLAPYGGIATAEELSRHLRLDPKQVEKLGKGMRKITVQQREDYEVVLTCKDTEELIELGGRVSREEWADHRGYDASISEAANSRFRVVEPVEELAQVNGLDPESVEISEVKEAVISLPLEARPALRPDIEPGEIETGPLLDESKLDELGSSRWGGIFS